jgi:1,5-anhydro-D-fructose reductase (1,5-anhydro-D-mannitol-forming)
MVRIVGMPSSTRGWGVIATSWIAGDFMIPAIRASGGEVVAVLSRDADRARAYAARNGIARAFADLGSFVADPDIEAVYISSTNQVHRAQAEACAAGGKAVLCEKPMATSLADAQAIVEACRRAGVVLAVNHHIRNAPSIRLMKDAVAQGLIGRPLAVRIANAFGLPDFLATWRLREPGAGAGVVLDVTSHDADTVRFLLDDEVVSVIATTSHQGLAVPPIEDSVMGVMTMRSGVTVSHHDAYTCPGGLTGLEIHGDEGSLVGRNVLWQRPEGEVELRRDGRIERLQLPDHDDLYETGIRAFHAAMAGTGQVRVSGEDGVRSLAVALAVKESAAIGRRVNVSH